jgi:nitrogen fixation protein FixH
MSEQSDYQPKGGPLTGRKVLMILVGCFGVMLSVNFYMAHMAVKTFPGLDQNDPYDVGIAYNKEIDAAKAQTALGWSVDLSRTFEGDATRIIANVKDKAGQPVSGLDASMHFFYPTTRKLDQIVAANAAGDGVYSGAAGLQHGHWEVEITFNHQGVRMFRSRNAFDVE